MSELGDLYRDWREEKKKNSQENFIKNKEILKKNGILFVEKNEGMHLIIKNRIDFWPNTGLFKDRKTKYYNYSARKLLDYLKRIDNE